MGNNWRGWWCTTGVTFAIWQPTFFTKGDQPGNQHQLCSLQWLCSLRWMLCLLHMFGNLTRYYIYRCLVQYFCQGLQSPRRHIPNLPKQISWNSRETGEDDRDSLRWQRLYRAWSSNCTHQLGGQLCWKPTDKGPPREREREWGQLQLCQSRAEGRGAHDLLRHKETDRPGLHSQRGLFKNWKGKELCHSLAWPCSPHGGLKPGCNCRKKCFPQNEIYSANSKVRGRVQTSSPTGSRCSFERPLLACCRENYRLPEVKWVSPWFGPQIRPKIWQKYLEQRQQFPAAPSPPSKKARSQRLPHFMELYRLQWPYMISITASFVYLEFWPAMLWSQLEFPALPSCKSWSRE